MCNQYATLDLAASIKAARDTFEDNLDSLGKMQRLIPEMMPRDKQFSEDLLHQFVRDNSLSPRQWQWVGTLMLRYANAEPIYGTFNPILVMFRLAQSKGLKRPRVRLLSSDPEPVYFELWFRPGEKDERTVEIMRGGWQGSGRRQFAGWIRDDRILPWKADRVTTGMRNTIQDLALDPAGVAQAMAKRLSACLYCGQRLADPESKARGYGETCANNWSQPWGHRPAADPAKAARLASLQQSLDALWTF
jgi:hypothetical protein